MIRGIDLASHQHPNGAPIDWAQVRAAGYEFAVIKQTEATSYINPYHLDDITDARAAGLAIGHYHYARPATNSPEAEADYFSDAIEPLLAPGEIVVLDLEEPGGDLRYWSHTWLSRVTSRLGFRPLLYSFPAYLTQHNLLGFVPLAEYGLWYASWATNTEPQPPSDIPAPPAPWPVIAIWQDFSRGTVPGIQGAVDLNWFNGDTLDQFRAYGKPGPAGTNPYWSQIGPGLAAAIRQRGDEPTNKERYIKDADGQDAISIVAGKQRGYIWWPDSKRVTTISYDPPTPPG